MYRDDEREEVQVDSTLFLEKVWAKLKTAIDTREGDWRTPTLATVDTKGAPDARLIVLRTICRNICGTSFTRTALLKRWMTSALF